MESNPDPVLESCLGPHVKIPGPVLPPPDCAAWLRPVPGYRVLRCRPRTSLVQEPPSGCPPPWPLPWEEAPKSKHSLLFPPPGDRHIPCWADFQSQGSLPLPQAGFPEDEGASPLGEIRGGNAHFLLSPGLPGTVRFPAGGRICRSRGVRVPWGWQSELFWVLKEGAPGGWGRDGAAQTAFGQSGGVLSSSRFALGGSV